MLVLEGINVGKSEVIRNQVEFINLLDKSLNVHLQPGKHVLLKNLHLEFVDENPHISHVSIHVVFNTCVVLLGNLSAHNLFVGQNLVLLFFSFGLLNAFVFLLLSHF